jgi:hypothetical protein
MSRSTISAELEARSRKKEGIFLMLLAKSEKESKDYDRG